MVAALHTLNLSRTSSGLKLTDGVFFDFKYKRETNNSDARAKSYGRAPHIHALREAWAHSYKMASPAWHCGRTHSQPWLNDALLEDFVHGVCLVGGGWVAVCGWTLTSSNSIVTRQRKLDVLCIFAAIMQRNRRIKTWICQNDAISQMHGCSVWFHKHSVCDTREQNACVA